MKKFLVPLIGIIFNTIVWSQEFCDPAQPQCHICDAATDEELEVVGYDDSSYIVNEIFVKVNPTLLQNIDASNADFGNVQVNNLSDSYGLKSMERMGESDYYVLTFNNIKDLQCTMDGYLDLVDEVSQKSYFEEVFPETIFESNYQQILDSSTPLTNYDESTIFFINPTVKFYDKQWYLRNLNNPLADIDARRAWAITKGSNLVEMYIIDGFFSFTTEKNRVNSEVFISRDNKIVTNPENYPKSKGFNDIIHGEADLAIYGSYGLNQNNFISGIDWYSTINLIEVVDLLYTYNNKENKLDRYGVPSDSDFIKSMDHLNSLPNDRKINVVNFSIGSFDTNMHIGVFLSIKLSNVIEKYSNALFIVGANDFNREINSGDFPASTNSPNILVVGGSDENDSRWETDADFGSGYGSSMGVVAPANRIYGPVGDKGYGYWSGNSHAAPIVSGIASLIYSLQDETQKAFTALEVKDMIITTAEKYMFTNTQTNEQKIVSFPTQRDEKLANGRVNAHQAVLLAAAHLNHYKEDNKYILKATDNRYAQSFIIPYDKVLFDSDGANRRYALMLNRHKFSVYKLPSDLLGANGEKVHINGGLIWESDIDISGVTDFDNYYAKELKLSNNKLHLYTLDGQISWSADIPIVDYLDLGNNNQARQCKIIETAGVNVKEVCTTKSERDEHNNLGLDNGHFVSQKLALDQTTGDLIVVRIYKNRAGEELTTTSWNSSAGIINDQDLVHRHLLQNATVGCTTEIQGNFITNGTQLKQNECMYSSDRNYRTILLGNQLVTQKKIIDDDGTDVGETIYEDVSSYNLN